ncbi:hypothetical protein D9M68_750470 [compost metagenome]
MRPDPHLKYTHEQEPAISSLAKLVKLIAFAGTGKTTTLVGYALARPHARILYLCYNKSVEIAAKEKFPFNVMCKTAHGLAYASHGAKYKHKLYANLRLTDIARIIGSQKWEFIRSAQDTLNNFLASADDEIGLDHCPPEKLQTERMRQAALQIVAKARFLWVQMCDVHKGSCRDKGKIRTFVL